jgi:hypothetical protein
MLDSISEAQFQRWQAFFLLNPWGPAQEELRFGVLCSIAHNGLFAGKRLQPADLFPALPRAEEADDDPAAQEALWRAHTLATGGAVVEPGKDGGVSPASAP